MLRVPTSRFLKPVLLIKFRPLSGVRVLGEFVNEITKPGYFEICFVIGLSVCSGTQRLMRLESPYSLCTGYADVCGIIYILNWESREIEVITSAFGSDG